MYFEMLAPLMVGKSKHHDSLSKMADRIEFKWGLKDSRTMETWCPNLRYVEEWNYFDYYADRWTWFGLLARLPLLKPRLATRIVHLQFL